MNAKISDTSSERENDDILSIDENENRVIDKNNEHIIILQMPIQTDTMGDGLDEEEMDDDILNQEVSDLGYVNGDNDSFIEDPEIGGWDQSNI